MKRGRHPYLRQAIQDHGIVSAPEGEEFTLASGAKSKFYIDFSRIVMIPSALYVVVKSLCAVTTGEQFEVFGGPSSGADAIVGAYLLWKSLFAPTDKQAIRGFTVRKEPKGRGPGAGLMYEGYLSAGDRIVLVEDVTTSGQSLLRAIEVVHAQGADVVHTISLLDRQAGAEDLLKDYGFTPLVYLDELKLA